MSYRNVMHHFGNGIKIGSRWWKLFLNTVHNCKSSNFQVWLVLILHQRWQYHAEDDIWLMDCSCLSVFRENLKKMPPWLLSWRQRKNHNFLTEISHHYKSLSPTIFKSKTLHYSYLLNKLWTMSFWYVRNLQKVFGFAKNVHSCSSESSLEKKFRDLRLDSFLNFQFKNVLRFFGAQLHINHFYLILQK